MPGNSSGSDSEASSSSDGNAAGKARSHKAPSVATTGGGLGALVICDTLTKARTCLLCNSTSVDDNRLEAADPFENRQDLKLPLKSYEKRKSPEGDAVRVPSGRLCLICSNVYRALGSLSCLSHLIILLVSVHFKMPPQGIDSIEDWASSLAVFFCVKQSDGCVFWMFRIVPCDYDCD